jgi:hypothetical protein
MNSLDGISIKKTKHHISAGLAEGIKETIIFSHKNFLKTIKPKLIPKIKKTRPKPKKHIKKK